MWTHLTLSRNGLGHGKALFHPQKFCLSRLTAKKIRITLSRTIANHTSQVKIGNSTFLVKNMDTFYFKRQLSLTSVSSIWLPWSRTEPPAIPPDPPATEVTSTAEIVASPEVVPSVDATTVADQVGPITDAMTGAIIDPAFVELGLASSWWPNHFVHQIMELVHINTGLSWWSAIIIGTITIRVLTIPLYIFTRKYTINQSNHSEEMQQLVRDTQKYKYREDNIRFNLARKKLKDFYKRTGTGPVRGFFANSSMSILFITCVTAVRQMCAVPVPSFVDGGMMWFTDLSAADPYYILPVLTGTSMGLIINIAVRAGTTQRGWTGVLRKVQYLPVVIMPLAFGSVSSGVYLYWLTTSVFSLGFQRLLLLPGIKEKLKFPIPKPIEAKDNKGVVQKFRDWKQDSYQQTEMKMQCKAIQRARKERKREQKKALKGEPPITYTIGVDAIPKEPHKPDFEREWRPPKPKQFGTY